MNRSITMMIAGGLAGVLSVLAGCQSRLPLEQRFAQITVGQSDATEVLNLLPEDGMLHTSNAVSVLGKWGWGCEMGIVTFNEADSVVRRKEYLQRRSGISIPPFVNEKLYFVVQTLVPEEVLNEPYEDESRKHAAILRHCQEALIADAKPFAEDQETQSLMGMARSALGVGILEFSRRPREAGDLLTEKGFGFEHPVMGKTHMRLEQHEENNFTLSLRAADTVDPFNPW